MKLLRAASKKLFCFRLELRINPRTQLTSDRRPNRCFSGRILASRSSIGFVVLLHDAMDIRVLKIIVFEQRIKVLGLLTVFLRPFCFALSFRRSR